MNLMDSVKAKAKSNPVRVAFPEANDVKMLNAISIASDEGYCSVYIVGHIDEVKKICEENNPKDFYANPQNARLQEFLSKVL